MSSIPTPRCLLWDECDAHRDHLALESAYIAGLKVGRLGLSVSLNPFQLGIGHSEWRRGWSDGIAEYCAPRFA